MYSEAGKKLPYLLYNGLASDKGKRVGSQGVIGLLWVKVKKGVTRWKT